MEEKNEALDENKLNKVNGGNQTVGEQNFGYYVIEDQCLGCGSCAANCPERCIEIINTIAVIDKRRCTNCGKCAYYCPTEAIQE